MLYCELFLAYVTLGRGLVVLHPTLPLQTMLDIRSSVVAALLLIVTRRLLERASE
jgi:hypothetical protein